MGLGLLMLCTLIFLGIGALFLPLGEEDKKLNYLLLT